MAVLPGTCSADTASADRFRWRNCQYSVEHQLSQATTSLLHNVTSHCRVSGQLGPGKFRSRAYDSVVEQTLAQGGRTATSSFYQAVSAFRAATCFVQDSSYVGRHPPAARSRAFGRLDTFVCLSAQEQPAHVCGLTAMQCRTHVPSVPKLWSSAALSLTGAGLIWAS